MLGTIATLPVGTEGIDYSFARPDPFSIVAAGQRFVSRYLADPNSQKQKGKILTVDERDRLAAMDLGLMLNWEAGAGDPLQGESLGKWYGAIAQRLADDLEAPDTAHIVVSCDVNISQANWEACDRFWLGFASENSRPLGCYVESDYMEHLSDIGLASLFWWPAASSWSNGRVSTLTHVKQLISAPLPGTDGNVLLRETPFWFPNRSKALEPDVIPVPPVMEVPDMASFVISYGDIPGLDGDGAVYELVAGSRRHVTSDEWVQVVKGVAQNRDGTWPSREFWQPAAYVANGYVLSGMPVYSSAASPGGGLTLSDVASTVDTSVRTVFREADLNVGFDVPAAP